MSQSEDQAKLLNEFFKSLGEVDEESRKWKEYHESAVKILRLWFEFMGSKQEFVKARIYGSSAENLKNYSFDDVGDLDVLLCLGEGIVVDESLLEYSPTNPAFVKIKGAGHPLLQSRLVEDTEYVCATDVRDLNPFVDSCVFGFTLGPRIAKVMMPHLPTQPRKFSVRERETDSPALTIDFSTLMDSRDILSRRLEQLKQLNIQNLDSSELEVLPVSLFSLAHVEYTPQHAEVFDDFVQHFKDSLQFLRSDRRGIIQGMPDFVQEIWSSENAQEIRSRFCSIESGFESEHGSKPEDKSTMTVPPEIVVVDENENRSSPVKQVEEPLAERCVGGKDDNSHETSKEELQRRERVAQNDTEQIQALNKDQKSSFFSQTFKHLSEENMEAFRDWLLIEKAEDFFDFLDTTEPVKDLQFSSSEKSQCTQSLSIDVVPALQARGWPKVAREWISRKRKWPSPDTVHRIIQEGFHLVVKSPESGGCPETDFRLSFSHAEYLLSQELNDIQRQCYRGLKKYYSVYLLTDPKYLVTYHLKTILLQTCEETGPEMWTEENRTACTRALLANLCNALQQKCLRHFFLKECNLFTVENIETPHVLESLLVKVDQFMRNPLAFSPEFIPAQGTTKLDKVPLDRIGEEAASHREYSAGSIVDNLPRSDPEQIGLPGTKIDDNKASSSEEQSARKMVGAARKDMVSMHNSSETLTGTAPLKDFRFHDLKVQHNKLCLELLTTAVEGGNIEELDPLESSLVEGIRELISVYNLHPEKLLEQFEKRWQATYMWMYGNCEIYTKNSMLEAITNTMKVIKNAVSEDGSVLGYPTDYSLMFPHQSFVSHYRRLKRVLDSMAPKQSIAEIQDDIPLD